MAYLNTEPQFSLLAATSNSTITIPAGFYIQDILFFNNTANSVTGGIRVGTTDTGTDVCVAVAVAGNAILSVTDAALLKKYFSPTVDTILYVQAVVAWNSANLNIYFVLRRIV